MQKEAKTGLFEMVRFFVAGRVDCFRASVTRSHRDAWNKPELIIHTLLHMKPLRWRALRHLRSDEFNTVYSTEISVLDGGTDGRQNRACGLLGRTVLTVHRPPKTDAQTISLGLLHTESQLVLAKCILS